MRGKKKRLDPETVVLAGDWLTPVARLMSLWLFFSFEPLPLSSPSSVIGQAGTGSEQGCARQLFFFFFSATC